MRLTYTLLLSIAGCVAAQAQSLQLLSTFTPTDAQSTLDAAAAPNRLYVADFGASALRIYDTSQPTALKRLSDLTGILRPNSVVASGTKVYLNSRAIGTISDSYLYAVDVSNGAAPSVISQAVLPPDVVATVASSTLVCTATSPNNNASNPYPGRVYVYDSNLKQLNIIARWADDIALNDKYLYILSGSSLDTYDLSTPTAPAKVSSVAVGPYTKVNGVYISANGVTKLLALANNHLYINGHAGAFSLSNPALPVLASTSSLTFSTTSGSTAYQLSFGASNAVKVVDLRVPTAPVVAATATTFTNADPYSDAVTGQGDLVYVVRSNGGRVYTYRYTAGVLATRGSASAAFTLYPNPAIDEVTLKLPAAAVAGQRVALLNVCGQLVREQALPTGSTSATISLATLSAGVYFVQSGGTIQKLLRQ
jgi:hypothetical protein